MQTEPMLERLAWIIKTYGVISSDFYDRLSVERPSRWSLRQQYGTWKGAVESAIKLLESQGEKIKQSKEEDNQTDDQTVIELKKQIEELTRHYQSSNLCFTGTVHRFGVISDTHLGSLFADKALLNYAYEVFAEEGIKTVLHAGDLCDGMRMYKGQEFELSEFGCDAQINLVINEYPKHKGMTTYFITGNHDRSFWKLAGTEIGDKISIQRPDMVHLGHQEADIKIGDGDAIATVRLCHPDGGTAYAICYDDKTEVFTDEGWKLFKDLNHNELVCTLNRKTNSIEFEKPISYVDDPYDGEMIHFSGMRYDLLVTPNHRMWVQMGRSKKWDFIEANKITKGRQAKIYRSIPNWIGIDSTNQYVELPIPVIKPKGRLQNCIDRIPIEQFVQLLGWYLSEGSVGHKNRCIQIAQRKSVNPEYYDEIVTLLKSIGFKYYLRDDGIVITSLQLYEYFKQFGRSHQKHVPKFIKEYDKNILMAFLIAFFKGDGNFKNGQLRVCSTTSKQMADDIQEIALKCGLGCSIKTYLPGEKINTFKMANSQYQVSIALNQVEVTMCKCPNVVEYSGRIYCVETLNGILLVRRNGKPSWSGNSYKIQQYINALASGTKPDILLMGHYHKTEELYYRGVVAYQAGTLQAQTSFMRGKQLAAAMGFRILEVTVAPKRVVRVTSTFFPVRS